MEEEINILENLKNDLLIEYNIELVEGREYKEYLKEAQALENLLTRYKQLEEENKELLEVRVSASAHTRILELEEEIKKLKNNILLENKPFILDSIPKSKVKEIRDKAEVMDYYTLPDVIEDLNKLLEEE